MKICFLDSGIGGLSVYAKFIQNLHKVTKPIEKIVYFADLENSPYGNKSRQEITELMKKNIAKLKEHYDIELFVLACNTATACSIQTLRKTFPNLKFVGIEPNLKQAIKREENTLVMTTTATYFFSKFLSDFKSTRKFFYLPQRNLAKFVDENFDNEKILANKMKNLLQPYLSKNIKNVVLGCTHYLFLKNAIVDALGEVTFFDSIDGVVKRIISLLN